jgi:hypothetical protein
MANIIISHQTLDPLEWTPVFAPGPCLSVVVEHDDPDQEWAMSSDVAGDSGTTRTIRKGCAVEMNADRLSIQPDIPLFYAQGSGELVVAAGMGAQIRVAPSN